MWWVLLWALVVALICGVNWWARQEQKRMTPEARRALDEETDHEIQTW